MSASESRLCTRWAHLVQPNPINLTCEICKYNGPTDTYKIYKDTDLFNAGELIRYQCPKCDLIFGDLRFLHLTSDEISQDYEDLYSFYQESDTTKYILACLNTYEPCQDATKTYLDYGCGKWNHVVSHLRQKNYQIVGYDKIITGPHIINDLGSSKYDVIYASNLLEHFIHPIDDIKEILTHLNDDGYLIFMTACFEYCYTNTHYHVFYFIGPSLQMLCEQLGIVEVYSTRLTFDDNAFTIMKVFKKNLI
jgi:SAM-dependent methyltransferase